MSYHIIEFCYNISYVMTIAAFPVSSLLNECVCVTQFAKIQHNGACGNFQYKAIIKLSIKHDNT